MGQENIVIVTTKESFVEWLAGAGYVKVEPEPDYPMELPTRLAKKYLKERGHMVGSGPAFNRVIREYQVTGVRRGKENWYKVKDLERVPARR